MPLLREVTLGQYFPGNSVLHKMDPRMKIILLTAYIVFIFLTENYASLAIIALSVVAILFISHISPKMYFKSIKAIIYLVLFTAILNLFYATGEPLWQWHFFKITEAGINNAVFVAVRIITLVLIGSVLTYTTSPTDLTDGIERLLKPLTFFRIKVNEIAMMMTVALRFIPTLLEETDKIMSAQKARGADFESGNLINRIKALIPVLIPLIISSFRRAYELAVAMESRCYNGGSGRTRMKVLRYSKYDFAALAVLCVLFIGVIICNLILPAAVRSGT